MQEFRHAAGQPQLRRLSTRALTISRGMMFRYFESSPMLSQGVLLALNAGG